MPGGLLSTSSTARGSVTNASLALVHVDQALGLPNQLGIVLMVAVFVLYPALAQAALSVFSCIIIDDGQGPLAENQRATWPWGYWARDMNMQCYTGMHMALYVPIGIVSVLVFCFAPPFISLAIMYRVRQRLATFHTKAVYGFLYKRYRPRWYFWESILLLQTLALVAVDVVSRSVPTLYRALLLLAALIIISSVNMVCSPMRSQMLLVLEFISQMTLCMTITLSLFFIDGETDTSYLGAVPAGVVGVIIIVLNLGLMLVFTALMIRHSSQALQPVEQSWHQ
ncbi:hypothetical protein HXX76_012240 [Chlamydomonas incerta]|uniref:TRP C-terminal domain-containing protein n=1 Tax=Chlamydomonas incerta TaxID=51695 RepID=A0A835VWE3_CHLIN|nr:hypothetical protein HXX76_012240 [Chlamydomonas incerta]|eukprot:KAG2427586.1 hypothetical protein HXX76_012240 [Chlamydomonas incerta]